MEKKKRSHHKKGEVRKPPAPELLRAMRTVFRQTPDKDRGEQQLNCRTYLLTDPAGFIKTLGQLESAQRSRMVGTVQPRQPTLGKDESSELVLEVAEQWLKERSSTSS